MTKTDVDADAIRHVHRDAAFGGDVEALRRRIASSLRERGIDGYGSTGESYSQLRGRGTIWPSHWVTVADAPASFRGLGLGPVGVRPKSQARGLGSSLIREGLRRCRMEAYDASVGDGFSWTATVTIRLRAGARVRARKRVGRRGRVHGVETARRGTRSSARPGAICAGIQSGCIDTRRVKLDALLNS